MAVEAVRHDAVELPEAVEKSGNKDNRSASPGEQAFQALQMRLAGMQPLQEGPSSPETDEVPDTVAKPCCGECPCQDPGNAEIAPGSHQGGGDQKRLAGCRNTDALDQDGCEQQGVAVVLQQRGHMGCGICQIRSQLTRGTLGGQPGPFRRLIGGERRGRPCVCIIHKNKPQDKDQDQGAEQGPVRQ
jgi:hypothetical protein